jgi:hypothetical protein
LLKNEEVTKRGGKNDPIVLRPAIVAGTTAPDETSALKQNGLCAGFIEHRDTTEV